MRPRAAVQALLLAPGVALSVTLLAHLSIIAALIVFHVIAGHVLDTLGRYGSGWEQDALLLEWAMWHQQGAFGPAEVLFVVLIASGVALTGLMGWFNLPLARRRETLGLALLRCIQAVVASLGLLTVLVAVLGAAIVSAVYQAAGQNAPEPEFAIVAMGGAGALFFAHWVARVARLLSDEAGKPEIPPRCEGCGYDLTHRPADERCPECGLDLAVSIGPTTQRKGTKWAGRGGGAEWVHSTFEVIFKPRQFYTRLRLRSLSETDLGEYARAGGRMRWRGAYDPLVAANRFSVLHYAALGLGCATCLLIVWLPAWMRQDELPFPFRVALLFACAGSLFLLCAVWGGQRVVAALAATRWAIFKTLPDGRWAAIVLGYETAFVWVFFLLQWSLLLSYCLAEDWVSEMLGKDWARRAFGQTAEFVAMVTLILGLGMLWIVRYERIGRWVRWSNY